MISKLFILCVGFLWVTTVSAYVVTWTGDDEQIVRKRPTHLLGEKMCTRGPAYWCHNITQAKECHAVHHCIEKVWEDMTLPEDNDSVCQICKDMVKQARDQLMSNETIDELRQVLEGSCNLIPLKLISKECRQLADEFIPELVDTLASRMDPQAVCSVSGLCNSARIDEMLGEMKPVEEGNAVDAVHTKFDLSKDSCPKCKFYLGKSIEFLRKMPENGLLDKLFEICGRLGSYSDSCRALAMKHIDSVYSHVQNDMNSEEMCGLVGLCEVNAIRRIPLGKPSTAVRAWSPPTTDDNLPCDFCKQLVVHVKQWLVANTTRDEFRDILRGICKQTGSFRKECLNLVQEYGKPLYQLLIDETDPDVVCGQIGVCPTSGKFQLFGKSSEGPVYTILASDNDDSGEDLDTVPMVSLLPGERLTGDDERNAINLEKKKVQSSFQCQFCEYALDRLKAYIENPREEEQVREAVDKLCDEILPREMAEQCTQFVSEYGNSLIIMIAEEIDSTVICPKLGVCKTALLTSSGGNNNTEVIKPIKRTDHRTNNMDVPTCPLCHFAVAKIIHIIGENRTKVAIDRALDSVCYVLPKTVREDCINFMTYYGNQIGELLVIQLTAREVCMALGLCVLPHSTTSTGRISPPAAVKPLKVVVDSPLPSDLYMPQTILNGEIDRLADKYPGLSASLRPTTTEEPTTEKADQKCIICEFAISKIAEQLKDNATEEEIRDTVEKGCSYLPSSVKAECKSFIEQYANMIISYLAEDLDPKEVCEQLGLCTNAKMLRIKKMLAEGIKKLNAIQDVNMGRCQLCMVLSEYLSAMLEDPKVETSVDSIVEKICPIIPTRYRSECKEMVEDYGPYIMSLLAQATDKGHACSVLSLCPNSTSILTSA